VMSEGDVIESLECVNSQARSLSFDEEALHPAGVAILGREKHNLSRVFGPARSEASSERECAPMEMGEYRRYYDVFLKDIDCWIDLERVRGAEGERG